MSDRPPRAPRWVPLGAAASGALLYAAFPPLEWSGCAWFALVPLTLAVHAAARNPGAGWSAGRLGYLAGGVFWLLSIAWLTRVTMLGWLALALFCALFFVPPVWILDWGFRRWGAVRCGANLALAAAATVAWCGCEYLRAILFTGFPWHLVGYSQYLNLPLIQWAAWGGGFLVSAAVVGTNFAAALAVLRYAATRGRGARAPFAELAAALALLLPALVAGARGLAAPAAPATPLRLALIQPGIPQTDKWSPEKIEAIYTRLAGLTTAAWHAGRPDLVVWPETAVPDDVRNSEASFQLVRDLARQGAPLLVGSMDTEWRDDGPPRFYNSAFLFDREGRLVQSYDKRHLVLFGEYVPLQRVLPFVKALTPIEASFSPGRTSTVFCLEQPAVPFAVLICFEDTIPALARESVRNGARLLINQTNDAWFDPSAASRQQMIQCVFRCVENRVPAARATNTGVTCCIDPRGRVHDLLRDADGDLRGAGFRLAEVRVPGADLPLTFYTRHGDLFGRGCLLAGAVLAAAARWPGRRRGRA